MRIGEVQLSPWPNVPTKEIAAWDVSGGRNDSFDE
jgi:hypothetical protein